MFGVALLSVCNVGCMGCTPEIIGRTSWGAQSVGGGGGLLTLGWGGGGGGGGRVWSMSDVGRHVTF